MQPNLTVRKFYLPPSLNLSTGYTYVLALTKQFLLVAHFRVYHQIWFSKNVEIQPRVAIFSLLLKKYFFFFFEQAPGSQKPLNIMERQMHSKMTNIIDMQKYKELLQTF